MKTTEHPDASDQKARRDHFSPGQTAPHSGQYELVSPTGERTGEERTVVRGEPLPPTPLSGMSYILSDPSKNGAGTSSDSSP